MRGKIEWTTDRTVETCGISIPVAQTLRVESDTGAGASQAFGGVRPEPMWRCWLKLFVWPLAIVRERVLYLGHGFLHRMFAQRIRVLQDENTVFLEVGCGDPRLRHALRGDLVYNGLDFAFSLFQLWRFKNNPRVNLCMGSMTDLPVKDKSVSIIACVEVLTQIEDLERVLAEMKRVLRPGGTVLVTASNGHSRKFAARGPAPFTKQFFTFDSLGAAFEKAGFTVRQRRMLGKWIQLPRWFSAAPMQLPITSKDERDNNYFVYELEA